MPRRRFDDDDDFPRRPPRRDFDDDRPRARPRRFDDDEDDYDEFPRDRRGKGGNTGLVIGLVAGGFVILAVMVVGGIFAFRSAAKPAAPPMQAAPFPGNPNAAMGGGAPQPVFVPPGVPRDVLPNEVATECVVTNLRRDVANGGFASAISFDYDFQGRNPIGGEPIIAILTEPGRGTTHVNLPGFFNAKGSLKIDLFGRNGGAPSGTTIYLARGFGAANSKRISNVATLP